MPTKRLVTKSTLAIVVILGVSVTGLPSEPMDYLRDIKPLLKARCYACHGALKQEAGLRLDTGRFMRQGGDSGAVVIPDKPEQSRLIERVSDKDAKSRMPPEGEPLTSAQTELLRAWIADGAKSPDSEQAEADARFDAATRRREIGVVAACVSRSDRPAADASGVAGVSRR